MGMLLRKKPSAHRYFEKPDDFNTHILLASFSHAFLRPHVTCICSVKKYPAMLTIVAKPIMERLYNWNETLSVFLLLLLSLSE